MNQPKGNAQTTRRGVRAMRAEDPTIPASTMANALGVTRQRIYVILAEEGLATRTQANVGGRRIPRPRRRRTRISAS